MKTLEEELAKAIDRYHRKHPRLLVSTIVNSLHNVARILQQTQANISK